MKDAYYFPHYTNARRDNKIRRIIKHLGVEGYGIFFMLLEVLREQSDFKYPMQDIDLLADEFGTSEEKVKVVITAYDLFIIDECNKFFSPKLLLYLKPYFDKVERARNAAHKRWNNANALPGHCSGNTSKVKEVKEVKELQEAKPLNISFEIFWGTYGKKVGSKVKAEKAWNKLKDSERDFIMHKLPAYVNKFTDKQYQPYPTTFLNERRWEAEDEITQRASDVIDGGTF